MRNTLSAQRKRKTLIRLLHASGADRYAAIPLLLVPQRRSFFARRRAKPGGCQGNDGTASWGDPVAAARPVATWRVGHPGHCDPCW